MEKNKRENSFIGEKKMIDGINLFGYHVQRRTAMIVFIVGGLLLKYESSKYPYRFLSERS